MTQTLERPKDQERAIAAQEQHGTPYARTKSDVKAEAARLAEKFDTRASPAHFTTWLSAAGDAYSLHLDSQSDGLRVNVHRWHSTNEIRVRATWGSFWRPRVGREGEYRSADYGIRRTNAGWALYQNGWRVAMLKTEQGALDSAVRRALAEAQA